MRAVEQLQREGCLGYVTVVAATADMPPGLRYLVRGGLRGCVGGRGPCSREREEARVNDKGVTLDSFASTIPIIQIQPTGAVRGLRARGALGGPGRAGAGGV